MEVLEIIIILVILCAQFYVTYLALRQINSISHFLSSEDNLELVQTTIDLNESDEAAESVKAPVITAKVSLIYLHEDERCPLLHDVRRTINNYLG